MKLSDEQKKSFQQTYNHFLNRFIKDALEHREIFLDQVEKFGTYDHDMNDLATKGFLYNMQKFHDHHAALQGLIDEAKSILKK